MTAELLPPAEGRDLTPYQPSLVHISLPQQGLPRPQADGAAAGTLEHEIRRPARKPELASDVLVPLLQGFMVAAGVTICAGVFAHVYRWPLRVVAIAFAVSLITAWLWRMRIVDALLWEVERIVGRDHAAPARSPAEHEPIVVNSWQARQEVRELQAADAGQRDRQALVAYLHRCYVAGTSEKAHGISRGSGAERDNYIRQRDVLLELGIAQWRNPARPSAGWKIVVSHQKALALLAKHTL